MAFKSEFMKIFKEGLEPYGFKRMKGTDFFGKLINNEILLYVSYKQYSPPDRGVKAFDVIAGVQTIYSYDLTEHQLILSSGGLINHNISCVDNIRVYFEYTSKTQSDAIDKAFKSMMKVIMPIFEEVKDLPSCLEYLFTFRFGWLHPLDKMFRDSILLIVTENHDSFEYRFNKAKEKRIRFYNGNESNPVYQTWLDEFPPVLHELIDSRDRVWASKELQDKVFSEANRRAEINKAQLRKYGFDI